jgi:hypothetical protein
MTRTKPQARTRASVVAALTPTARLLAEVDSALLTLTIDPFRNAAAVAAFLSKYNARKWRTLCAAAGIGPPTDRQIHRVIESFWERAHTSHVSQPRRAALTRRDRQGK